jgi:ankyrin repeat protein
VKYLLASGARPGVTDRWGGTPLTDAKRAKHIAVAELLAAHDPDGEPASGVITDLFLKSRPTPSDAEETSAV